ncbi:hypothetical protein DMB66_47545 [Actinoplanes sp. ATCC 53533]|nr:hypothetical protein DMB66_47545 [Actinoplanes sp. ATCC 53533]
MGSIDVMASKMTNKAVERLKARQAAERVALEAAAEAAAAVGRAVERRSVEVARLDAAVADAERGADVALAVLASLVPADVAAVLTEETPARVRLGQQRAPVEDVTARVEQLTGGVVVARRRGRPRGSGAARTGRAAAEVPAAGVEAPEPVRVERPVLS